MKSGWILVASVCLLTGCGGKSGGDSSPSASGDRFDISNDSFSELRRLDCNIDGDRKAVTCDEINPLHQDTNPDVMKALDHEQKVIDRRLAVLKKIEQEIHDARGSGKKYSVESIANMVQLEASIAGLRGNLAVQSVNVSVKKSEESQFQTDLGFKCSAQHAKRGPISRVDVKFFKSTSVRNEGEPTYIFEEGLMAWAWGKRTPDLKSSDPDRYSAKIETRSEFSVRKSIIDDFTGTCSRMRASGESDELTDRPLVRGPQLDCKFLSWEPGQEDVPFHRVRWAANIDDENDSLMASLFKGDIVQNGRFRPEIVSHKGRIFVQALEATTKAKVFEVEFVNTVSEFKVQYVEHGHGVAVACEPKAD